MLQSYRLTLALPAVLAAIVYAGILQNGFVYDDNWTFTRREVWEPTWWEVLFARRGVTFTFHRLDRLVWGDAAFGFHLTSLLLHALASTVVAGLAVRLSGVRRVGLVAGLLFAVHPVHVDAVASYANRGDILAMIFAGCALWAWQAAPRRWLHYAASLGALGLGILAKEASAVGAALLLPLSDLWLAGRDGAPRQSLRLRVLTWAPLLALGGGLTLWFTGDLLPYFQAASIARLSEGVLHSYTEVLATVLGSLPSAFRLLLFPWTLSFDYPIVPQRSLLAPGALLGLALLVGWLGSALAFRRKSPLAAFSMFWVVLTYLPSTNVFPIIQYYVAERFLYVPSFGICVLIALAVEAGMRAERGALVRKSVAVLAASVVAAGAARTGSRTLDWNDERTLAASALAAGVETRRIHHMLGEAAWRSRDFAAAVRHFERCVELEPAVAWLRYDVAAALTMQGDLAAADAHVAAAADAVDLRQRARRSLYKLALVSLSRDLPARAAGQLRHLLGRAPTDVRAKTALAWILATSESDALRSPIEALAFARGSESARGLGALAAALAGAGYFDRAADVARRARMRAVEGGDETMRRQADALLRAIVQQRAPRLSGPQLVGLLQAG